MDQENTSLTKAHVERFVRIHSTELDSEFALQTSSSLSFSNCEGP